MRLLAGSKINLLLKVMPVDGAFHPIQTIFHPVGLDDEMTVSARTDAVTEVVMAEVGRHSASLPPPDRNLVTRAIDLLRAVTGRTEGVAVSIAKRIPIAAGLAGGSSDAAATLVALRRLWELDLDEEALARVASSLGSDVPYCLTGGTCIGTGRGESLERLSDLRAWFVLGISHNGLSTAQVYRAWDRSGRTGGPDVADVAAAVETGDLPLVGSLLHNDLEPLVLEMRPELGPAKEALIAAGALGALVSGSGPTLFGLCDSRPAAEAVARAVSGVFERVEVASSKARLVEIVEDSSGSRG